MGVAPKKLLVVGSANYDRNKDGIRIDCVPWDGLGEVHNISDYDLLLINTLGLREEVTRLNVDWERFQALFDFVVTTDVLTNGGKIVILGDPRFSIPTRKEEGGLRPFLYWTGVEFAWDNQPGDTINYVTSGIDHFSEYRRHFKRWSYALGHAESNEAALSEQWNLAVLSHKGFKPRVRVDAVCSNRYGRPLVFWVRHLFPHEHDRDFCSYGPILFLPDPGLDEDALLQLALRDFCAVPTDLPEPAWMSDYPAPGQKAIDEEILKIETDIAHHVSILEKAIKHRMKARTCLKLLYEREFGLEPVVRDVLRQLGAHVEDPIDKNKEDGWIRVEVGGIVYEGVLEIKSTKSDQFGEDGRKQLLDWMDRGRTLRQKNYKGIFIGNSAVTKALKDRPQSVF